MNIKVRNLSKSYIKQKVFSDFTFDFDLSQSYAIIGANGSGKSTLLLTLAGVIIPYNGIIEFSLNNKIIDSDNIYQYISIINPNQELIEEFNIEELLDFHFKFRKPKNIYHQETILRDTQLWEHRLKSISLLSSGMRQRVKLILLFYTDSHIIFLDEPTSFLDKNGIEWYLREILKCIENQLVIIASNDEKEYSFCTKLIKVQDYQ